MAITVFSDVVMPSSVLSAGVRGKNMRNNTRVVAPNDVSMVNQNSTRTLREFEIGFLPMLANAWEAIEGLYEVTEAGVYGFLMRDPKDQIVDATEGLLQPYAGAAVGTIGLGYGIPTYRLYKRYTSTGSSRTKDRQITRPLSAGFALRRAGGAVTLGASAGNAALDANTGTVTFVADQSQAHSSITVGATTVLNYANGTGVVAALAVGGRVYITGVTGTAAAALNGLSHAITAKGATSLTISTVTTGLTVTAAGTASVYPQPTESLTWSGGFYVPVHFANDGIDWELVTAGPAASRIVAGPQVLLREVRE